MTVLAQKITWFSYQALLGRLFRARSSGVSYGLRKSARLTTNETFNREAFKTRKKVVNKTYNYEFMMHLPTCRSITLVFGKDQDEQATNASPD